MFGLFNKNIKKILPKVDGKYIFNAPLSKLTWFGVGGPAEVLYIPKNENDLSAFLKNIPHNLPRFLIGGGSNLLVRDGGLPGVVIKLDSPAFKTVKAEEGKITCGAGLKNIDLKRTLIEKEIGGLEFLCSIPGTIGGSVKTNAGCFGKELKDILIQATIVNSDGEAFTVPADDLQLSYRNSYFPDDWIITSLTFKTEKDTAENIQKILDEHKEYRKKSQPYNQRTAGSTFKNPEGLRAWELIKKSGCCNLSVGGAKVSEKHCNFLINTGKATADDIESLGEKIREEVKKKTFITLEWEVKRLGVSKK